MVNSEASIAGFTLQVDPEVPGDVHRHLARLPLGSGQSGALSLVQISPDTVLSLVEPCHDMWLPCTERIYFRRPYAIMTHRKAREAQEEP